MAFRAVRHVASQARHASLLVARSHPQRLGRSIAARTAGFQQSSAFSSVRYLDTHEYIRLEGDTGTVGISDFAQSQLGDVVFVDLPEVGEKFEAAETFGSVESVKAASDVYLPVAGEITEVNDKLLMTPEMVNSHAMSDAWFVKIKVNDASEFDGLLDEEAYKKFCEEEEG